MSSRNHSRRVHAPDGGHPEMGHAGEHGGERETWAGDAGRWAADQMGDVRGMISDRPHTSVMTAFGLGFGLGLLATLLLSRDEEGWFERYAPDAIQDLPGRLKHAGHRITSTVPGSIQQAGESLASYVPTSWKRW
jgi:hypothetical protein